MRMKTEPAPGGSEWQIYLKGSASERDYTNLGESLKGQLEMPFHSNDQVISTDYKK